MLVEQCNLSTGRAAFRRRALRGRRVHRMHFLLSRFTRLLRLIIAGTAFSGCASAPTSSLKGCPSSGIDDVQFADLLAEVAAGWNSNDAERAAAAFHLDAIYSEPPAKQIYQGREALFEFFGGASGRKSWMRMTWHHISFDASTQIGAGEFTFAWPGGRVHGMTSVRIRDCLIANWREYFYDSELDWEAFQGLNRF